MYLSEENDESSSHSSARASPHYHRHKTNGKDSDPGYIAIVSTQWQNGVELALASLVSVYLSASAAYYKRHAVHLKCNSRSAIIMQRS